MERIVDMQIVLDLLLWSLPLLLSLFSLPLLSSLLTPSPLPQTRPQLKSKAVTYTKVRTGKVENITIRTRSDISTDTRDRFVIDCNKANAASTTTSTPGDTCIRR
jgi:hypothetical protein